ncbi:cytochrome ubiquinol oxidase subunit I [Streptomyces albipurpureus]|uniref:Cytochrome ubiquinol oxidase subunit I n=1 Tax=Streptomyces albipurpureus TaxID=2897419 RepID=A0ABT0UXF8_9ACTN|nr:cytochrome ubiquinol oxidase subunit I [Streptomyces sp. CWNU-1]MCM2393259.1 cytochrome ubiquinol oxidase subunit I [Streptomyces sp. CWNU-1]
MSAADLARLQFAATTGIHWLFVILTMGLVPFVAIMHTRAAFTRDPVRRVVWERMARFWGQLYVINYAVGIVTGLVMEFQFGLSWSGLSKFAGNVFGAPLALETLIAFFAESTFLGMWIFGWGRLSRGVHTTLIWLVALTAYASAYWIMIANGFMQHPVGHEVRDGVAYLTDFGALLTNPNALVALAHIALAALTTGGVLVAGISAFHFARGTEETDLFRSSLRLGTVVSTLASFFVIIVGDLQLPLIRRTQPMKAAALENGDIAQVRAQLVKEHGPGDYVFAHDWLRISMDAMTVIGNTVSTIMLIAVLLLWKDWLVRWRPLAYLLTALIPFPFIASVAGWIVREVGRQPWIIYGELKVEDALSPVSRASLVVSCTVFIAVFVALAVTNWTLIARFARRGPVATQLGTTEPIADEDPHGHADGKQRVPAL